MPAARATLTDDFADDLLAAIDVELLHSTPMKLREGKRSASTSRRRAGALQAQVLAYGRGVCPACERDLSALCSGAGLHGLEVHHLDALGDQEGEIMTTSLDRLVAVCGGCHGVLHSAARPSIEDVLFEWRPACPDCSSKRALGMIYGLAAGPWESPYAIAADCLSDNGTPGLALRGVRA